MDFFLRTFGIQPLLPYKASGSRAGAKPKTLGSWGLGFRGVREFKVLMSVDQEVCGILGSEG